MPTAALKLRGLIAPAFTPMRADGSLDLDRVEALAEHLEGQGIVGVFVAGTTGEGLSLTLSERRLLTERWCAVAAGRFPVIAHVGHACLSDAKDLAAHAQQAGATAVAAVPPFYYAPKGIEDIAACCAQVAAAAPLLPFYYYHIPANTGVEVDLIDMLEVTARRVPTLAGLKFSDADLDTYGGIVDVFGSAYDCFFGVDELLLPALSVGAKAAIGTTYNFAADYYHQLIDAFRQGNLDDARRIQNGVRGLAQVMQCRGGLSAMKATMGLLGVDCGPCRLPLRTLTDAEADSLAGDLGAWLPVRRPGGPEGP
jgi:N-acetylneuraminate lyase